MASDVTIHLVSTTLSLAQLYRPIEEPLDAVRGAVGQLWLDALQLVGVQQDAPPAAGGKMLRPALCLLSAGAIGGRDLKQYVQLAAAFEALHIASLAHDDVIDKALLRRGATALHAMWDNHAAVLGGDYLVARAVEILAQYDSCPVSIELAQLKTASLFAEACSAPTFIINPTHRAHLHAFGVALGTAFQLVDDLLDITQPAEHLGKPSCGDVVEGKKTLPIIFLRSGLANDEKARFDSFQEHGLSEDDRSWISAMAERTGALENTLAEAREYTAQAHAALAHLPSSEFRESMEGIADLLLDRSS